MYGTSMHERCGSIAALILFLSFAATGPARAQMPGVAVLQNAFSNPGITAALNYSGGGGKHAGGVAAAWAPSSGRFQISAGAGTASADTGSAWTTYGGRVAVPLTGVTGTGAFGIAPFVGIGGGTASGRNELRVPVGVGVGYRMALGNRGVSVYAAPFFSLSRRSAVEPSEANGEPGSGVSGQDARTRGLFRFSAGLDMGLTRSIGVTIGYDGGAVASPDEPGPRHGLFGAGVSWAFRR